MHRSPLLTTLRLGPDGSLLSRAFYTHGTAQEVADLWAQGLGNAQQKMQAGVNRVQTSPGQAAAAAFDKWMAKLQDPAVQQKWRNNVGALSLQSWKDSMNTIGVSRAAQGATAKKAKFVNIMNQLLPYVDQGRSIIQAMPSTTYQDREARALAWFRYMRDFQRTG